MPPMPTGLGQGEGDQVPASVQPNVTYALAVVAASPEEGSG